jgi:hypothetical protein
LGYLVFVKVGGKLTDAYIVQSIGDFRRAVDRVTNQPARRVLLIVDYDGPLLNQFLNENYPTQPAIKMIRPSSQENLIHQLHALEGKQAGFDQIDLLMHGAPGHLNLKISDITQKSLEALSPLHIAKPGAQVRIYSCHVGMNTACSNVGEKFMQEIGRILLPEGGSVFASTKRLNHFQGDAAELQKQLLKFDLTGVSGPLRLRQIAPDAVDPQAWYYNHRMRALSAVEVEAIPTETCLGKTLRFVLKKHR